MNRLTGKQVENKARRQKDRVIAGVDGERKQRVSGKKGYNET